MAKETSNLRFWTILAIINIAVMAYPVGLYAQSETNDVLFPAVVMVGTAFLLVITDAVSAILAFLK